MKVISLNVGKPKPYSYHGREGFTSIFKSPVHGERQVSFLNFEGDEQSDLKSHGGKLKAIYSYDISYYHQWQSILNRSNWDYGLFGENLTTIDLLDSNIFIGNIYQVGSVYLRAVQPRFPCFKLNIRLKSDQMIDLFIQQQKHGTYFSVVQPGSLKAGDNVKLIEASTHKVTIQQR